MAFRIRRRKGVNIARVVGMLATTLITLWAGGTIISAVATVMNGTCSPLYGGLSLVGFTVGTNYCTSVTPNGSQANTISAMSSTGILSVIGIIGIASIVLQFVEFKLK